MPLKQPIEIPKIPKTRNKKAEAAIEAIPAKKPDKPEYTCKAFFYYDSMLKKQYVSFTIETVLELKVFSYEISIDVVRKKDIIYLVIMGLSAKTNYAPQVQPARKDNYFEDLIGDITVNVVKQDGSINSAVYNINFLEKKITLLKEFMPEKENNRRFCNFYIAPEENTFKEE
ncbi:MAG TPA: hypothetical protein PL041_11850 [Melioribacteraceae bacterium]|nr:hypothetical protein [Melioribacteraceae bacterium]